MSTKTTSAIRLTAVMTHPVQYAAAWFRYVAACAPEIALTVLYATEPTPDQQGVGFQRPFKWDVPLLEGYCSRVIAPAKTGDSVSSERFWGLNVPEMTAAIRNSRPDVVLVPGWHSITLVRSLWACRRLGIPVLYRGDTTLSTAPVGWRRRSWAIRTRLLLRLFDGYLSVGQRSREYLGCFGAASGRIFDTPHCVDNEFFAAAATPHQTAEGRSAARARFGLGSEDFVVLFVGKLEQKKRPLDLLRAVAGMGASTSLLMVGAGPLEPVCRAEAHRLGVRVAWVGFLNQSALGQAYAAADCLALPSDGRETWGLVVNEALATGLPCVVSDQVGCAPDLVRAGESGEVFPVAEIPACAAALERIRRRQADGHDFAPACRAIAATHSFAVATRGLLAACRAVARPMTQKSGAPRVIACCSGMVIVSGLERSTFEALRVLREQGAAVHCLVNSWENQRIVALAEDVGASWSTAYHWYIFERHTRNPIKWAQFAWDVLMTSLDLMRAARRFRATHVLLPEFASVLRNAPALALLRLLRVAVILRVGNAPPPGPFYRRVWRWGVSPFVDRIVCNSRFTQSELLARGIASTKVRLIYNTLPTRAVPQLNGTRPDSHKIIYVGQVIPEKGLDLLLDAVGVLAARGHDVSLEVVGQIDGWVAPNYAGYRERLLARASAPDLISRVRFLGWRDDVPALIAAAAVHCCPSRPEMLEGFPLVTLEAKYAGIPSVAFPVGPFPELIEHGKDGFICADISAQALAEGLAYFLTDPCRQAQAGQAARASAERFTRPRFAEAWWTLLHDVGAR
jgi:glycosyltransferase involved in cell wall biosynthesis